MIYHLLDFLHAKRVLYINPFQYETFRAGVALVCAVLMSLALGPRVINMLRGLKAGQPIRTVSIAGAPDLSKMHAGKAGTPTMGGVLIVFCLLVPVLLFCDLLNPLVWLLILVTLGFGALGFADDYFKVTRHDAEGIRPRTKILGQAGIGLFVGLFLFLLGKTSVLPVTYVYLEGGVASDTIRGYDHILVPFIKQFYPSIGILFVAYVMFVLTATSNGVNLTDGLDGLCIGVTAIVAAAFWILVYICGNTRLAEYLMFPALPQAAEVTVFMGALVGACLGFLWFNSHPAEVFMGDTGSLTLGGVIGTVALISKQEMMLLIVGGVFVIELLSVIIQVASMKLFKRRVFLMSPIHHHYERKGLAESKIIARFWIAGLLMALVGLSTLKLR